MGGKRILISIVILLCAVLYSCNPGDKPPANEDKVDSYKIRYMHYNFGLLSDDTVKIQYHNGNIIKRIGGGLDFPGGVIFDPGIYETVTYNLNQASVVKGTNTPGYTFSQNEKKYFFNGDKIDKCVIVNFSNPVLNDTIKYFYSNDLITGKTTYRNGLYSHAGFYYNGSKNIDSIITRYSVYNAASGTYEIDPAGVRRDKETFEDFDSYVNPAKKLVIFEETFNRSLSVNNYRKYNKKKFDQSGIVFEFQQRLWTFSYENGKIDFTK